MEYLSRIIDPLVLEGLIVEYRIGVTKAKETIFFQIDKDGGCRTGKVMKYNPETESRMRRLLQKLLGFIHYLNSKAF